MIEICMATYNAQRYLQEQLQSIFAQTCQGFHLVIRDNNSTDDTVRIIQEFAKQYPGKITLIAGTENLGAKGNFAYLMGISRSDYVMFSDADDVWLPHKIAATYAEMCRLEAVWGKDTPLLVHGDLSVVDRHLNLIHPSFWKYSKRSPDSVKCLNRLVMQNSVTGCTVMVNRSLLEKAIQMPPEAIMHDWWLALVAVAFGHVGVVEEPLLLYRQHSSNVLGAQDRRGVSGLFRQFRQGVTSASAALTLRYQQAHVFLERYNTMLSPADKAMLEAFVSIPSSSWWTRKKIFFQYKLYPHTWSHKLGVLLLG